VQYFQPLFAGAEFFFGTLAFSEFLPNTRQGFINTFDCEI